MKLKKSGIMKIIRNFVHYYRNVYNKYKYRKLNNHPCIISRDCIGGALYKDFNLEFTSPMINLEMSNKDFVLFCNHLNEYIESDVKEYKNSLYNYPVGIMDLKYGKILIHFAHYKSFNEAYECWNRRKKRIDYNNIYIIMCVGPEASKKTINMFESIKYKNKILLSSNIDLSKHKDCFNMNCYNKGYRDSLIAHYNKYSFKRYLSEVDWVKFFNKE